MPSIFPTLRPPSDDDQNRRITFWQPGDPRPLVTTISAVLHIVIAVLMGLTGVSMLRFQWTRPPVDAAEAERLDFILTNLHILGAINLIAGIAILLLAPALLRGGRRGRRWLTIVVAISMFFQLAGWVMGLTGGGQALFAFLLAIALLLAFRPAANTFFDADLRRASTDRDGWALPEGDGRLPGDELRS